MQDPYSAMMASHQRNDPFKNFMPNRQTPTTANSNMTNSNASDYYHGLNYGSSIYGSSDSYTQGLTMASALGQGQQDYSSPMPAHMGGSQGSMNSGNNGIMRLNQSSHTISHTATSPGASSHTGLNMPEMTSPLPSGSNRVSLSPEGYSHLSSNNSPETNSSIKQESSSSDNSSVKSTNGNDDDLSGVPPKKRQLSATEDKDSTYWDKRKKNNESAKRSREARRMKEEQIAMRVVYLEQENLQLRTEVSLLKSEIEKLRCMLYNS